MQRALRRHRGIELAHRAGRGVARIDEELLAGRALPLVQRLEVAPRHVDLAAHLEHRGRRLLAQALRNGADRADVAR